MVPTLLEKCEPKVQRCEEICPNLHSKQLLRTRLVRLTPEGVLVLQSHWETCLPPPKIQELQILAPWLPVAPANTLWPLLALQGRYSGGLALLHLAGVGL